MVTKRKIGLLRRLIRNTVKTVNKKSTNPWGIYGIREPKRKR